MSIQTFKIIPTKIIINLIWVVFLILFAYYAKLEFFWTTNFAISTIIVMAIFVTLIINHFYFYKLVLTDKSIIFYKSFFGFLPQKKEILYEDVIDTGKSPDKSGFVIVSKYVTDHIQTEHIIKVNEFYSVLKKNCKNLKV